ncbi:hypothetical protein Tco_0179584 [Tanacetum coccineum]
MLWQYVWYKIGDGSMVSLWHDRWDHSSPLSDIVSSRDIHRAGLNMGTMIKESICNGQWRWPSEWSVKYPSLAVINVPSVMPNVRDSLEWRVLGISKPFSVTTVWDTIRPRGDVVGWYGVVWFSQCIPRHAFHLWLVIKRKLKTQDNLRQWDVSNHANLNLFQCPLCGSQSDSHEHLFFECAFSLHVWNYMKVFAGLPTVSSSLNAIVDAIIARPKRRSVRGIIARLVFAASTYFIWQERNYRLFKNQRRTHNQLIECIKSTVRLKLLTCSFNLCIFGSYLIRLSFWTLNG